MTVRRRGKKKKKKKKKKKNEKYSVSHDWLKDFAEFCLKSKGFQIF